MFQASLCPGGWGWGCSGLVTGISGPFGGDRAWALQAHMLPRLGLSLARDALRSSGPGPR